MCEFSIDAWFSVGKHICAISIHHAANSYAVERLLIAAEVAGDVYHSGLEP